MTYTICCSISNCHYWSKGNQCKATEILITSDTMAQNLSDMIDAPYATQIKETPAGKADESCCKTFVLKTDYNQNLDGVLKK
ncbi:DUF1540 domain-containing protein [Desulforamulus aeronauticus]|uniref:DUF1540 domain-containing protein n=1 Tax=Desulforamulus aeronauticus DSM 10349 TaxID=1121421 RepID=A0A1M6QVK0_9FIRM|nr:DUF1540 domain-containing protein [Desulforamulus aeronauticus]SHK24087.1 protein of unknown function [Desulforamulus aeronauticus DSM 10349]